MVNGENDLCEVYVVMLLYVMVLVIIVNRVGVVIFDMGVMCCVVGFLLYFILILVGV